MGVIQRRRLRASGRHADVGRPRPGEMRRCLVAKYGQIRTHSGWAPAESRPGLIQGIGGYESSPKVRLARGALSDGTCRIPRRRRTPSYARAQAATGEASRCPAEGLRTGVYIRIHVGRRAMQTSGGIGAQSPPFTMEWRGTVRGEGRQRQRPDSAYARIHADHPACRDRPTVPALDCGRRRPRW